jgi:hypothetical protein
MNANSRYTWQQRSGSVVILSTEPRYLTIRGNIRPKKIPYNELLSSGEFSKITFLLNCLVLSSSVNHPVLLNCSAVRSSVTFWNR